MTENAAALASLSQICGAELRLAELVYIRFYAQHPTSRSAALQQVTRRCYLGIGKHALYLVKRDLSDMIPGGQIYFAHIEQLVEDSMGHTDFCVQMNENRPSNWDSPRLFIVAANRATILKQIEIAFLSDHMWRFARVVSFPKVVACLNDLELRERGSHTEQGVYTMERHLLVLPFAGFRRWELGEYFFFLPQSFERIGKSTYANVPQKVTLDVYVHAKQALHEAERRERHVRWLGLDYKAYLTRQLGENKRGDHWMMYKNHSFLKKMDLSDDVAAYSGWQIVMQCKGTSLFLSCIFLRRHFCPPLLDTVQDVV
ncbi:unnamed protein product, partial [Amoebophrya sp. A25]|eukprot:GSA25T00023067001.1